MFDDYEDDEFDIEEIIRSFKKRGAFRRRRRLDGHCYRLHEDGGVNDSTYFVEQTNYLVDGSRISVHKHQLSIKRKP